MTIQQALAAVDPFGDDYLWIKRRKLWGWDMRRHLALLLWMLVDPNDLRRISVNTIICLSGSNGDFTEHIRTNIDTLKQQNWDKLDPNSTLYNLSTWHCGTVQDINAWIQQIELKGDLYDL